MRAIFISILSAVALQSCQKYVDIKTQGSLVPSETINYRYLLNNDEVFASTVRLNDIGTDEVNIIDPAQISGLVSSNQNNWFVNAYTWQSPIYPLITDQDYDWNKLYKIIYNANVVIAEVPASTGGTDEEKRALIAEALVHRADAYLTLINMYAKPYSTADAVAQGVPLLTVPDFNQPLTRATIQKVYDQIFADLQQAIPSLGNTSQVNILPTKAAAYAELARAYLYTQQYALAGNYADSALKIKNNLLDYQTVDEFTYPNKIQNPEIILQKSAQTSFAYMFTALRLSDHLLNLLGTDDLRYKLFTADAAVHGNNYTGRFFNQERIGSWQNRNIGPTVPEMMLIKAEALARAGQTADALQVVNKLREKRFTPSTYTALTAGNAEEALVKVIEERQRETFCRGLRWFDMRRLKDEAIFSQTYSRNFNGNTYTLSPDSKRYVYPIAEYVRSLNPGITQNP
jgi:tetratricopeptide (TPR) repeat protein